jgi:hypothetical protein
MAATGSIRSNTRSICRVEWLLTSLKVDQHLAELPEAIVRRYARRLASRAPAVAARIAEPTRTIEVACFLRYSLMISTDHLLWMCAGGSPTCGARPPRRPMPSE